MSTLSLHIESHLNPQGLPARMRLLSRALTQETLCGWRNLARMPAFSLPTLLFPVTFYVMFAVVLPFANTPEASVGVLVNFTIFGVVGPGLFAFGVGLANDRDEGWLRLKQASPLPIGILIAARMLVAMMFALAVVLSLFAVAATVGGRPLSGNAWLALGIVGVLAVTPASALGMLLGAWLKARSAVAVVNIAYLGSAMLSGLWFPLHLMPDAMQSIAPWLPPYHLAEIARFAVGADAVNPAWSAGWLTCVTIVALLLASPGLRRQR